MVRVESSRTPSPTPTHGRGTGTTCDERFGNKAGGTLAFAQDLNDPNLTKWVEDGPLSVEPCGPRGGSSAVWQVEGVAGSPKGRWNALMLGNGSREWRYETTDPDLKQWTLADENFHTIRAPRR